MASTWRNNMLACIGIVAIETFEDEWKAYISIVPPEGSEKSHEQFVAAFGAPLLPGEAHGFFPQFDIEKYKKD